METRQRLYNRGRDRWNEISTRDNMNGKLVEKNMPPCFSDPYKAAFTNRLDHEKRLNSSSQATQGWK
jgi:hypothetical protein